MKHQLTRDFIFEYNCEIFYNPFTEELKVTNCNLPLNIEDILFAIKDKHLIDIFEYKQEVTLRVIFTNLFTYKDEDIYEHSFNLIDCKELI